MSEDSQPEKSKPNREDKPKKTETKPDVVVTKPKPDGPPNITIRSYADVILNKLRKK